MLPESIDGKMSGRTDGSRLQPNEELTERTADFDTGADLRRAYLEPVRTVISPRGMKLNYYRDGEPEPYDLKADPYEMENLATHKDHADTIEEFAGKIFEWQVRTRDPIYLP